MFKPWTIQERITGFIEINGELYCGINRHGILPLTVSSEGPVQYNGVIGSGVFKGRTIGNLFSYKDTLFCHVYRNTMFETTAPLSDPGFLLTLTPGERRAHRFSLPFGEKGRGWEPVELVPSADKPWSIRWKFTEKKQTVFEYYSFWPDSGEKTKITKEEFKPAYIFRTEEQIPEQVSAVLEYLTASGVAGDTTSDYPDAVREGSEDLASDFPNAVPKGSEDNTSVSPSSGSRGTDLKETGQKKAERTVSSGQKEEGGEQPGIVQETSVQTEGQTVVHLIIKYPEYTDPERYRIGNPEALQKENARFLRIPGFKRENTWYLLSSSEQVYVVLPTSAYFTVELPALPEGFLYTDFWTDGDILLASWEERRFPEVKRAGMVSVVIEDQ
jgi:hypothetical protein